MKLQMGCPRRVCIGIPQPLRLAVATTAAIDSPANRPIQQSVDSSSHILDGTVHPQGRWADEATGANPLLDGFAGLTAGRVPITAAEQRSHRRPGQSSSRDRAMPTRPVVESPQRTTEAGDSAWGEGGSKRGETSQVKLSSISLPNVPEQISELQQLGNPAWRNGGS
ncbi:hypothetical protein FQN52_005105 [Onygenales sp. PD_12]|nr:hypothetical protein FQN52_005105 [Onygenales sp. PD_12]